jgi:urate oxidase
MDLVVIKTTGSEFWGFLKDEYTALKETTDRILGLPRRAPGGLPPEVAEIRFKAPNKHHFLVDLSPFGDDNPGEVFYAADRPYGLIEAAVERDDASEPGSAWNTVPGFC